MVISTSGNRKSVQISPGPDSVHIPTDTDPWNFSLCPSPKYHIYKFVFSVFVFIMNAFFIATSYTFH